MNDEPEKPLNEAEKNLLIKKQRRCRPKARKSAKISNYLGLMVQSATPATIYGWKKA